jgi:hypothetical protein
LDNEADRQINLLAEFERRNRLRRRIELVFWSVGLAPFAYVLLSRNFRISEIPLSIWIAWGAVTLIIDLYRMRIWRCPLCNKSLGYRRRSNLKLRSCTHCGMKFLPLNDSGPPETTGLPQKSIKNQPSYLRLSLIAFFICGGVLFILTRTYKKDFSELHTSLGIAMIAIVILCYFIDKINKATACKQCGSRGQLNRHCDQCGHEMK